MILTSLDVIPAQAGNQKNTVCRLDSRLRGNDEEMGEKPKMKTDPYEPPVQEGSFLDLSDRFSNYDRGQQIGLGSVGSGRVPSLPVDAYGRHDQRNQQQQRPQVDEP